MHAHQNDESYMLHHTHKLSLMSKNKPILNDWLHAV